jgi:hypothetical protein
MNFQQQPNVKNRLEESAIDALPINVSAADFTCSTPARAILVGTGGNLEIMTILGNKRLIPNVPAGVHSIGCLKVYTANTTASNITLLI